MSTKRERGFLEELRFMQGFVADEQRAPPALREQELQTHTVRSVSGIQFQVLRSADLQRGTAATRADLSFRLEIQENLREIHESLPRIQTRNPFQATQQVEPESLQATPLRATNQFKPRITGSRRSRALRFRLNQRQLAIKAP